MSEAALNHLMLNHEGCPYVNDYMAGFDKIAYFAHVILVNSLKNEGRSSEVPSLLWEVQTALAQTCQGSDRRTRLMDTAPIRSCFGLDALSVRT